MLAAHSIGADTRMDILPDDAADGRWMTYRELAAARGVKPSAAVRLVHRRKWRRQIGNNGLARILVPAEEASRPPQDEETDALEDVREDVAELLRETLEALKQSHGDVAAAYTGQISALRGELTMARTELASQSRRIEAADAETAKVWEELQRESAWRSLGLWGRIMNAIRAAPHHGRPPQAPPPARPPAASSDLGGCGAGPGALSAPPGGLSGFRVPRFPTRISRAAGGTFRPCTRRSGSAS